MSTQRIVIPGLMCPLDGEPMYCDVTPWGAGDHSNVSDVEGPFCALESVIGPTPHRSALLFLRRAYDAFAEHMQESVDFQQWATEREREEHDDEPTGAQLERMNNPDSGPSSTTYRDQMRDAGRGHLLA